MKPTLEQRNNVGFSQSRIKIISFDLDDTLYDNRPIIQRAERLSQQFLQQKFEQQSIEYDAQKFFAIRHRLLSSSDPTFDDMSRLRQRALKEFCENLADRQNIVEQAFKVFYDARNQVEVLPEIESLLGHLYQEFIIVSVTNGNCDASKLTIARHFHGHYLPSNNCRAKPHPQMLLEILKDYDIASHELLHVGDSLESDGQAAQNADTAFYRLAPFEESASLSTHLDEFIRFLEQFSSPQEIG